MSQIQELGPGSPLGTYEVTLDSGSLYLVEFALNAWRVRRIPGPAAMPLTADRGGDVSGLECAVGHRFTVTHSLGYGKPVFTARSGVVVSITRVPGPAPINMEG